MSGFLVLLTEALLVRYHGDTSELAQISERAIDQSQLAYDTPGQTSQTYSQYPRMQYNYFLGYFPATNKKGDGFVINNAHFRYADDLTPRKEPGEIRIFVTGGSAAWGAGANQQQLYTTVAEKLFKKNYPGKNIRIICAGVAGYVSTQERIFIENHILDYQPDMIVMYSGWNDMYFSSAGKDIMEDGDLHEFQRHIYRNSDIIPTERGKILYLQPQYPNFPSYQWKILWAIDKIIFDFHQYNYVTPEPFSPNDIWSRVKRNVSIVHALSQKYGFSLIYFLQPNMLSTRKPQGPSEVVGRALDALPAIDLDENIKPGGGWDVIYFIFRERMPKLAEREDFLYYDSDRAIENESQSVFIDPVHMGDRGQRLVGHDLFLIIERELKRRGLIPAAAS